MKAKKVMALVLCAAMVSGLAATTVMQLRKISLKDLQLTKHMSSR